MTEKSTNKISKSQKKILANGNIVEEKSLEVIGNNLKEVKEVFDEEWEK